MWIRISERPYGRRCLRCHTLCNLERFIVRRSETPTEISNKQDGKQKNMAIVKWTVGVFCVWKASPKRNCSANYASLKRIHMSCYIEYGIARESLSHCVGDLFCHRARERVRAYLRLRDRLMYLFQALTCRSVSSVTSHRITVSVDVGVVILISGRCSSWLCLCLRCVRRKFLPFYLCEFYCAYAFIFAVCIDVIASRSFFILQMFFDYIHVITLVVLSISTWLTGSTREYCT